MVSLTPFALHAQPEGLQAINGIKLSPREIDIIAFLLNGRRGKSIASFLSIAPKTVETHIRNIMLKLDCNSREGIVMFIERSGKIGAIKEHYLNLLTHAIFEKKMKQISFFVEGNSRGCIIFYQIKHVKPPPFLYFLEKYLNVIGIKTCLKVFDEFAKDEIQQNISLIYIDDGYSELIQDETQKNPFSLIIIDRNTDNNLSQNLCDSKQICLLDFRNYYLSFFIVIEKMFPHIDLEVITSEFQKQFLLLKNSPSDSSSLNQVNDSYAHLEHTDATSTSNQIKAKEIAIRSDLIVPSEPTLLPRQDFMIQINRALSDQEDIQTVALIGIGGVGKTTIARLYAREQKYTIIWEINAETEDSLVRSFENLAYALSQNEEEKKTLRGLEEIRDPKDREVKVLLFVKNKLKSLPNWLLIYDNVEKFSDIQKSFPFDAVAWGKGKVIITSRDSNIQHNRHIHKTIPITELATQEKATLLKNIMFNEHKSLGDDTHTKNLLSFLDHIPSFPLDVSIAGYYLKTTNVSFEEYADYLKEYNISIDSLQKDIIKEMTQYTKTRYSLITISLDCILKENNDFKDLLLLISLIDSQYIPRELLSVYRNNILVNSFVYYLKKYSLIYEKEHVNQTVQYFNIHRSTQVIILAYLINKLDLSRNAQLLNSIADTLSSFITKVIDNVDFTIMANLKCHCEAFLSHEQIITSSVKMSIGGALGIINFYLGYYQHAQEFLEASLSLLSREKEENSIRFAVYSAYLGCTYTQIGNHKIAINVLEKSYTIITSDFPMNVLRHAWILVNLGISERKLGNFNKAKKLFEKSLMIYKTHSTEYNKGISWSLAHLGIIEKEIGNYDKARMLLEDSLHIFSDEDAINSLKKAWKLKHLTSVYRALGNTKKAKECIDQSLIFYRQYFPENHIKVAKTAVELANVHGSLTQYNEAKEILESSLTVYEKHFGLCDIETAEVLGRLGHIHLLQGNFETAEDLCKQALKILLKHEHSKCYELLELLADLYSQKHLHNLRTGKITTSQKYKEQSINYLKKAKKIIQTHFSDASPHFTRIQSKLEGTL